MEGLPGAPGRRGTAPGAIDPRWSGQTAPPLDGPLVARLVAAGCQTFEEECPERFSRLIRTLCDLEPTVATHKDALKRIRQNAKRRARNRHYRSLMRNRIKGLIQAIESGDVEAAQAKLPEAVGMIQRVASKGIIHKRQASRRVSRLTNKVVALAAGA